MKSRLCTFIFHSFSLTTQNILRKIIKQSKALVEITYGFRGIAIDIMKSYLTNRQQYTKIGNKHSTKQNIKCGVPQGSSLGPLLFILYTNDLPSASLFSSTLFTDDTLLSTAHKNLDILEKKSQF